jgi:hypothetical protein
MARIEKIELRMVDLQPKVKRTDAIQSFVSQETPIRHHHRFRRRDGTGYSYTIGTGGSSVMRLLSIISCRVDRRRCRHASRRSGTSWNSPRMPPRSARSRRWRSRPSIPRCGICGRKKQNLPLWKLAGGAKDRCPLYTTEGGWLHIDKQALVDDALQAKAKGFSGSKVKIGKPHGSEDYDRLSAVRAAVGDGFRDHDRRNQGFAVDEAIRRAGRCGTRSRLDRGAAAGRRSRRPHPAVALDARRRSPWANRSIRSGISANICRKAPARSSRSMSPASAASRRG